MDNRYHQEIETNALVEMYEARKSLREIGSECGMTYQAVQLRLKKAGVQLRRTGAQSNIEPLDRDLLVELYVNQQLSISAIEKRLNLPENSVAYQLIQHKIPRRSLQQAARNRRGETPPPREELERLYLTEGKSQAEIALELGKTQTKISKWIRSYGLKKVVKPETICRREQQEERQQKAGLLPEESSAADD
jgi:transposase-like protein